MSLWFLPKIRTISIVYSWGIEPLDYLTQMWYKSPLLQKRNKSNLIPARPWNNNAWEMSFLRFYKSLKCQTLSKACDVCRKVPGVPVEYSILSREEEMWSITRVICWNAWVGNQIDALEGQMSILWNQSIPSSSILSNTLDRTRGNLIGR